MVRHVVDHYGRIDFLVSKAGITRVGDVDVMDLNDFRHTMDVNFWGTVHTSLPVLPVIGLQGDGVIANVTSVKAIRRREGDVTLTWQARALTLAHALAPGATTGIMAAVSRLLPAPTRQAEDGRREAIGHALLRHLPTRFLRRSLAHAARTANQ